jgi:hypothetical protein
MSGALATVRRGAVTAVSFGSMTRWVSGSEAKR